MALTTPWARRRVLCRGVTAAVTTFERCNTRCDSVRDSVARSNARAAGDDGWTPRGSSSLLPLSLSLPESAWRPST